MAKLTSWGNYPVIDARSYDSLDEIKTLNSGFIPRGMGRSYGDSALFNRVYNSKKLNKLISFDDKTGVLTCQTGITFDELLTIFVPKGWFLPVTPGTKFVSVGGAIASDVHGKNHHLDGTFCEHLIYIKVLVSGVLYKCSPEENRDLFLATCGGMGLTGVITEASFKLKPIKSAYIEQKTIKTKNLSELLEQFEKYQDATYSVAWIDCLSLGENLGRSLLMLGEHAESGTLEPHNNSSITMPFNMPSRLLNPLSVKAFNALYFHKQRRVEQTSTVHYDPFFYPLDGINEWNKMYGVNGFTQYQFVIPKECGLDGLSDIITTIAESKQGSFLSVLKVFGKENENYLSFPTEGFTLALDFKLTEKLFPLLDKLDSIVKKYNGRIYLTKDARMSEDFFKSSYSSWEKFQKVRKKFGADLELCSYQSLRLGI